MTPVDILLVVEGVVLTVAILYVIGLLFGRAFGFHPVHRWRQGPVWLYGTVIKRVRPLDWSYRKWWHRDYLVWDGGLSRFSCDGTCLASKSTGNWDVLLLDPYLKDAARWYIKKYKVKI